MKPYLTAQSRHWACAMMSPCLCKLNVEYTVVSEHFIYVNTDLKYDFDTRVLLCWSLLIDTHSAQTLHCNMVQNSDWLYRHVLHPSVYFPSPTLHLHSGSQSNCSCLGAKVEIAFLITRRGGNYSGLLRCVVVRRWSWLHLQSNGPLCIRRVFKRTKAFSSTASAPRARADCDVQCCVSL